MWNNFPRQEESYFFTWLERKIYFKASDDKTMSLNFTEHLVRVVSFLLRAACLWQEWERDMACPAQQDAAPPSELWFCCQWKHSSPCWETDRNATQDSTCIHYISILFSPNMVWQNILTTHAYASQTLILPNKLKILNFNLVNKWLKKVTK